MADPFAQFGAPPPTDPTPIPTPILGGAKAGVGLLPTDTNPVNTGRRILPALGGGDADPLQDHGSDPLAPNEGNPMGGYVPAGGMSATDLGGQYPATPFGGGGGMRPVGRGGAGIGRPQARLRPVKPQVQPVAPGQPQGPGSAAGGMGGVGLSSLAAY